MKKIIALFLIGIFLSSNFSFALTTCLTNSNCPAGKECIFAGGIDDNGNDIGECTAKTCDQKCTNDEVCKCTTDSCKCENSSQQTNNNTSNPKSVMGITCDEDLLVNGQCKMNIYDTLGIRKSVRSTGQSTSVGLFVQDVVLSATFFIGTVVTIALIVSGIMFIFAASSGKDPANAKKGIIGSLVGLLIVVSSYVIIRLVQYIAKGF